MTNKQKVLITGVNGLIGGRIFELAKRSYSVVGTSRKTGVFVNSIFDVEKINQIHN
tara:strand:+ start:233 stop:400 length:168 start_codon:yes stop_codon:yes gene_type:complete